MKSLPVRAGFLSSSLGDSIQEVAGAKGIVPEGESIDSFRNLLPRQNTRKCRKENQR